MKRSVCLAAWLMAAAAAVADARAPEGVFATGAVAATLDAFHAAAAVADEETYFGLLAADAVFLGTQDSDRWTKDEFRRYVHPYFSKGTGWTYKATARWVSFSPERKTAWFDERLDNAKYGTCRGSGVLVLEPDGSWKIAQYNLSIPIPDSLAGEFVKRIADETRSAKEK